MGHLVGKDLFRRVGTKIDNLTVKAPWNDALYRIVEELFTTDEAEVYVRMPYTFSTVRRIARITGEEPTRLRTILEGLAEKGLVVDLAFGDEYHYMPSPMFIGIFEFTMMRTGPDINPEHWARLFHEYLSDGAILAENCKGGTKVTVIRALPHEETVADHVEILDYEKAGAIVDGASRFALGICSCRHEKMHLGERGCDGPLQVCTTFGRGADLLIRHGMAEEVSKGAILDNLARSREQGLVLSADNVQNNVGFICHCCSCCCNILLGISRFGYANTIVTSSVIACSDDALCEGCGKCAMACPIDAIEMVPDGQTRATGTTRKKRPQVDAAFCIGCGVCALACSFDAMRLHPREQRVLHPETTFRRVILQCLERGTLQYQLFDDPTSMTQSMMRAITGAFLGLPPVKRALMSETLRSRFLDAMEAAVRRQGKGEIASL